jgi:hypothetical protein
LTSRRAVKAVKDRPLACFGLLIETLLFFLAKPLAKAVRLSDELKKYQPK